MRIQRLPQTINYVDVFMYLCIYYLFIYLLKAGCARPAAAANNMLMYLCIYLLFMCLSMEGRLWIIC